MRILFIHKNYPAQFGELGHWMAEQGWDVTFATERDDVASEKVRIVPFKPHRDGTKGIHHYVAGLERAVLAGQGFARVAVDMRSKGYIPDIVVAHSGWGVGSFVKDIWPNCKFVAYLEWFYQYPAADRTPHDEPKDDLESRAFARSRNTPFWLDFSSADAILTPTEFQAAQFPDVFRPITTVLHDGIDTNLNSPGPRDPALLDEMGIPSDARIITYLARGMEPARGFPEMMRATHQIVQNHENVHVIVVGKDRIAYGARSQGSWKDRMIKELEPDLSRYHFTGLVPRSQMVRILRASDAHLYLTAPFVLSWSFLEAMSTGVLMVAADVAPVREFMGDNQEGLLVDIYDHDALVKRIEQALANPESGKVLRKASRTKMVNTMDARAIMFPKHLTFFEELLQQERAA
jgi:glycosyltransferase involved in cell wall biosynthesis